MAFKILVLLSLIIALSSSDEHLEDTHLIKLNMNEPARRITSQEMKQLFQGRQSFGYLDISRDGTEIIKFPVDGRNDGDSPYPSHPHQRNVVQQIFPFLEKSRMETFLQNLTSFPSRHARDIFGSSSVEGWLSKEIQALVSNYSEKIDGFSSLRKVVDPARGVLHAYNQENLIAKLEGQDKILRDERIILSANYDSINGIDDWHSTPESPRRAPGADGNGSGCAVLLEVLRVIVQLGLKFNHTIEFHFYTASELGLQGSRDVVKRYLKDGVKVKAMLYLNRVGYPSQKYGRSIAVLDDEKRNFNQRSTDEHLTTFVKMIVDEYLSFKWMKLECSGSCWGDHYNWNEEGFPAAFVTEPEFNDNYRTEKDTVESLDFDQINEYAKLGTAFVIELGQLAAVPDIPSKAVVLKGVAELGCIILLGLAILIGVVMLFLNVSSEPTVTRTVGLTQNDENIDISTVVGLVGSPASTTFRGCDTPPRNITLDYFSKEFKNTFEIIQALPKNRENRLTEIIQSTNFSATSYAHQDS
ncbi:Leucine aminopeptidase A [Orchesella cincta]|uniref:Leucine aminopeptidase A n=1 Tax=Orchesella cincta TaxID=48709 RepID=A0A1D2MD00_ORCCI|nr:Leucine aminopeptidase A [Orchesella cincta]